MHKIVYFLHTTLKLSLTWSNTTRFYSHIIVWHTCV